MKKKIVSLLLPAILVFVILFTSISVNAKDYKVINNEVIVDENMCEFYQSSLGIDLVNVNLESIVDTQIISEEERNYLDSESQLLSKNNVTKNDLKKEKLKTIIKKDTQGLIKEIYKELFYVDITNWTYSDIENYSNARDIYRLFSDLEIKKIQQRGIIKEDALLLIREYGTYDNIMNASDVELKDFLIQQYQMKIEYINTVKFLIEENKSNSFFDIVMNKIVIKSNAAYEPNMAYYVSANVPGYGPDIFIKSTKTEFGDNKYAAAAALQKLWDKIYVPNGTITRTTYNAASLWGSFSYSKGSAHEGIDFNSIPIETANLRAIMSSGTKGYKITPGANTSSYTFGYAIKSSKNTNISNGYTVFFMHSSNHWSPTQTILNFSDGAIVAKESSGGTNNIHNHFSVNVGYNNVPGVYESPNSAPNLTSANPYSFASVHTDGTYLWNYGSGPVE